MRRDIAALSRAAGRLRARLSEDQELADKLGIIESEFAGISRGLKSAPSKTLEALTA